MRLKYFSFVKVKYLSIVLAIVLFSVWGLKVYADGSPTFETATKPLCVQANGECEINNSGKVCCEGLVCLDHGQPSEDGKCGLLPTATPTVTPSALPSATPEQCPRLIVNDCGIYILQQN